MSDVADIIKKRAIIYKLLSLCYQPPQDDLIEIVLPLIEQLKKYNFKMKDCLKKLAEVLPERGDIQHLQVEHARLFIGPFDLQAPPYGSVYLENKRKVMGDSTMEVARIYEESGLKLNAAFKEPPDHITVELEFMYFLIFKELEGDNTVSKQRFFLQNYLEPWVKPFCERIKNYANEEFYQLIAEITSAFLADDNEYLKLMCLS